MEYDASWLGMILAPEEKGNKFLGENMKRFINSLIMIVTLGVFLPVNAQSVSTLLRLTMNTQPPAKIVGRLESVTENSIILSINGHRRSFLREQVKAVEAARGSKKNTGNGALAGAAVGALGLGTLFAIDVSDEQEDWFVPTPKVAFLEGLIIGGLLGAGVGAIIGAGTYSPRWEEIPLEALDSSFAAPSEHSVQSEPPQSRPDKLKKPPTVTAKKLKSDISPETTQQTSDRRFQISFLMGTPIGGPARDIESIMIKNHLADTSPASWFVDATSHPYSRNGFGEDGFPWNLSVHYRIKPQLEAGFLLSKTLIGRTAGYRKAGEPDWQEINLNVYYQILTIAPMVYLSGSVVKFGGGVAFYRFNAKTKRGQIILQNYNRNRIGFLLDSRLTLPRRGKIYVEMAAQYRFIPGTTIGPFTDENRQEVLLPEFEANYSHLFIGFGLGLRI